jgi:predicted CoA-binding protein
MKNIEEILKKVKTIAVVGLSPNPDRPSGKIAEYLISRNIAREAGLDFVQDKCIKIEHQRWIG